MKFAHGHLKENGVKGGRGGSILHDRLNFCGGPGVGLALGGGNSGVENPDIVLRDRAEHVLFVDHFRIGTTILHEGGNGLARGHSKKSSWHSAEVTGLHTSNNGGLIDRRVPEGHPVDPAVVLGIDLLLEIADELTDSAWGVPSAGGLLGVEPGGMAGVEGGAVGAGGAAH